MPSDDGDGQAVYMTWIELNLNLRSIEKSVAKVFTFDQTLYL
jgi:hypothetical protein